MCANKVNNSRTDNQKYKVVTKFRKDHLVEIDNESHVIDSCNTTWTELYKTVNAWVRVVIDKNERKVEHISYKIGSLEHDLNIIQDQLLKLRDSLE